MFGFFNIKSHLKSNRQVYFIVILIIFLGFLAGLIYSNMVPDDNFLDYSKILDEWIADIKNGEANTIPANFKGEDITNLFFIFFWSFFVFGQPFLMFFIFKSGFSLGFFISFFVKVYGIKGFMAGLFILFNYLAFTFLPVVFTSAYSFILTKSVSALVFKSKPLRSDINIKSMFLPLFLIFVLSCGMAWIGSFAGFWGVSKIINTLF